MRRAFLLVAMVLIALTMFVLWNRKAQPVNETQRNEAFAASMSGVTLVGHSTMGQREGLSGEERYRIEKVSHLTGDTWLFQTRLMFEGHDIPVPIPLSIVWAGDTPVITLTDLAIPGIGSYTARVVLYRDQYAGTWSGKSAGGQIFGRIVHDPKQ